MIHTSASLATNHRQSRTKLLGLICLLLVNLWVAPTGCKQRETANLVVLPQGGIHVLYRYGDTALAPIDSIDFEISKVISGDAFSLRSATDSLRAKANAFKLVVSNENGWIAAPAPNQTFVIYKCDELDGFARNRTVQFPKDCRIACAKIIEDILYAGGYRSSKREALWYVDLSDEDAIPRALELPKEVSKNRTNKRIDDLLIQGRRLIAVDDVVLPKYFIIYYIGDPSQPRLLGYAPIEAHGAYESIRGATIGNEWIAAFSTTSGRMSYSQHVTIYDSETLVEKIVLSNVTRSSRWAGYPELHNDTSSHWTSATFVGDTLLIGAGRRGIGVLYPGDIRGMDSRESDPAQHIRYLKHGASSDCQVLDVLKLPGDLGIGIVSAENGCIVTTVTAIATLR